MGIGGGIDKTSLAISREQLKLGDVYVEVSLYRSLFLKIRAKNPGSVVRWPGPNPSIV